MIYRTLSLVVILLFACFKITFSQLLQGDWRDHLSYRQCYSIADAGDWVYCGAKSGLISYNKETHALRKHSKVTGLSDVLVSSIGYSSENNILVVGYANGNIDLLQEGESPINLSDIKRKIMAANKRINDIFILGHDAYLSCGFGIVVLNLERKEIKETYVLGQNGTYIRVNDIAVVNNTIFAATETGIVSADLASGNLLDYNNWHGIDSIPQPTSEYKQIESYEDRLFAVYNADASKRDQIITFNESTFQEWNGIYDSVVNGIHASNGYFSISCPDRGIIYSNTNQLYMTTVTYGNREIYVMSADQIFVAATYSGFTLWNHNQEVTFLPISGPFASEVSKVGTFNDQVWVTTGGPSALYIGGAAYSFIDAKWTSYLSKDITTNDPIGNTYKVAIDPRDPSHVFVTSYSYGLIEFRGGEVYKMYDEDYEDLFDDFRPYVGLRISGIDFDDQGNLWMVMDLVSKPIFKIDTEGNWTRPNVPSNTMLSQERTLYSDLLVTRDGQIWILGFSLGVVVLQDDGSGHFNAKAFNIKNQSGNQLTTAFCMDEDNEGNIWIGTNNGPIVYYSPWNIFYLDDVSGYQIPIPRNDGTNLIDYLLFNEAILEIETDGGNRKWLGTENSGAFLVSSEGTETLVNFKDDNSPLLSNTVTGIGINEKSGEIFFATALGLLSYGGIATKGASDYSHVYVYPNPVRPEYEGNITITGLIENSIIKLTDVSGNLVWESISLGGQAIWDGRNFNGDKVASGVYLIMLATEDGLNSHITKVLFMH